jgi:hypothetical protein
MVLAASSACPQSTMSQSAIQPATKGSKVASGKRLSVWNACFLASSSGILRPICKEDWKTGGC